MAASVPPGIKLLSRVCSTHSRYNACRASVLLLTFVSYALYHASRKPLSVVKSVLHVNESSFGGFLSLPWPLHKVIPKRAPHQVNRYLQNGWAPFDNDSGTVLLGEVDVAFLASYAIGMYLAGHFGDRLCVRSFLTFGMVGSGILVCLFGLAYWCNIHWLGYFLIVQVIGGLFQATGWPSVVTVLSNWSGKEKRGFIMGVWNAHTSVGNICGTLIASAMLKYGWGWSFVIPGVAIIAGGAIIYMFLVVDPDILGLPSPYEVEISLSKHAQNEENGFSKIIEEAFIDSKEEFGENSMFEPLIRDSTMTKEDGKGKSTTSKKDDENTAVGFLQAWAIPKVAPFAFSLFFAKLVAYTFLYWLPFYIKHTEIAGKSLSDSTAGNLSTIFDVGGTLGGILAGYISDKLNARATVAAFFTYAALPALLLYRIFGGEAFWLNVILLFFAGVCVNGPYALITTAVSADLGTHESINGNAKALATVTAIIDGTGSVGAALGPFLTGFLSNLGWNAVFAFLMLSAAFSGLLLTKLVVEEWREYMLNAKLGRLRQISLL